MKMFSVSSVTVRLFGTAAFETIDDDEAYEREEVHLSF